MPTVTRTQRAEAKYNVVLDYPNLGLHAAAASGNLGLVKYALDHGQPVNSALDGVLPLHAASFNGHDLVVRLLIEHGADVNATRLPRRYSSEKHRTNLPPFTMLGASGSTPLHFAATNGHTVVVMTLLLHGAHPDRPDKHGMTPELLGRQHGHSECADVLREWCHNKDKDLREREGSNIQLADDQMSRDEKSHPYCGSLDCRECATRKRIRMKRSIDSALHLLRHSTSQSSTLVTPPHSAALSISSNQPPSPTDRSMSDEYSFYSVAESSLDDLPPRRSSLPHVLDVPRNSTSSHRTRRPSNLSSSSSSYRPRSAGTDAEQHIAPRVKGKISLLNIFKKGTDLTSTPESASASSSAVTSASVSPAPTSALAMTPFTSGSTDVLTSPTSDVSPTAHHAPHSMHQRLHSESAATLATAQAAELRHALSRDSLRGREQRAIRMSEMSSKSSPATRAGILRSHARSSSSGQSTSQQESTVRSSSGTQPSVRALRFESASSTHPSLPRRTDSHVHSTRQESRSPPRGIRGRGSLNSLRSRSPAPSWGLRVESEPENLTPSSVLASAESPCSSGIVEEDEEEHGHSVQLQASMEELKTRLSDLEVKDRSRRASVQSTNMEYDSQDTHKHVFDCPFSINRPPPVEETSTSSDEQSLGRLGSDSRLRGNSLSSMITDTSGGPPSSCVPTPSIQQSNLPGPIIFSPSSTSTDLPSPFDAVNETKEMVHQIRDPAGTIRGRAPLDLDLRTISSHAQAEALVALAQKRILDMSSDLDEDEYKTLGGAMGEGRTPLSARLAAYGESLAIERKFKEEAEAEKKRQSLIIISSPSSSTLAAGESIDHAPVRLDRQFSLQERNRTSSRHKEAKRPHTSSGAPGSETSMGLLSSQSSKLDTTPTLHSKGPASLRRSASSTSSSLTPPTSSHMKMRSETLAGNVPFMQRSRTPDPEIFSHGAPLTRYPTCPTDDTYNNLMPRMNTPTTQERQAARAQKLIKMGFTSAGGEPWRESPGYSRSQRHRFGGIKTLVQSITGRV